MEALSVQQFVSPLLHAPQVHQGNPHNQQIRIDMDHVRAAAARRRAQMYVTNTCHFHFNLL
jgi:hypothetical protein